MSEKRREEQFEPKQEVVPEELVRKTSRVILHAAERSKESLFKKLTAKNAYKMDRIEGEKPMFWENQQDARTEIFLQPELGEAIPPDFFENPTQWIEAQKNIERHYNDQSLPTGETIDELWEKPYDVSKVKEFSIVGKDGKPIRVVSKRINPKETEEVALALKAFEAGIPTPKVLGEVYDKGNIYAFFEKVDGIDLEAAFKKKGLDNLRTDTRSFFTVTDEEYFLERFNGFPFLKFISNKGKEDILNHWRTARKNFILEQEVSVHLNNIFFRIWIGDLKDVYPDIESFKYDKRFTREDIDRVISKYGFSSIDDLRDKIAVEPADCDLEKYKKLLEKLKNRKKYFNKEVDIFEDELYKIISENIFGVDLDGEKKRLEAMCKEKGIEHKDFAHRNILIEWDFEKNEPKEKDSGDAKLYIIDWETKSKPSPTIN